MRLDTDSADLRQRLAEVERERDATQAENAELRRRLAEMVEQASQPRGTYRPEIGQGAAIAGPYEPPYVATSGYLRIVGDDRPEPEVTITTYP